jgi:hypothetical protein
MNVENVLNGNCVLRQIIVFNVPNKVIYYTASWKKVGNKNGLAN